MARLTWNLAARFSGVVPLRAARSRSGRGSRRQPALRFAAEGYDRAARARYGQIPRATRDGGQLRAAARLIALAGQVTGDTTLVVVALLANLVALVGAVGELREVQQHAAQAAAARAAASQLHAACARHRSQMLRPGPAQDRRRGRAETAVDVVRGDFPVLPRHGRPLPAAAGRAGPRSRRGPLPPRRAGPGH